MKRKLMSTIILSSFLIFWEISIRVFNVPEYILPPPSQIVYEIYTNFQSLITHTLITLTEAVSGLLLGLIFAMLISILFTNFKSFKSHFYPYFVSIKTIPIIALAPLIILWFGHGMFSKIIIVALACFFPILINTTKGLTALDQGNLELFKSMKATKLKTFLHLRFPSALPYIFASLKIAATLAVLGAIVGEFIGANKGLGFIMVLSSTYLETSTLFAAIILSSVIGVLLFLVVSIVEKKVVFWIEEE